jgi:predicted amidohydrolase
MADRLRVACVQINSSTSKAENIERMEPLVARAAATGADIVLLPEKWNGLVLRDPPIAEPLRRQMVSDERLGKMHGSRSSAV